MVAEECLGIINDVAGALRFQLTFNRRYIGLLDGNRTTMFIHFQPKRQFTTMVLAIAGVEEWRSQAESVGLDASFRSDGDLRIRLRPGEPVKYRDWLKTVIAKAIEEFDE